MTQVWERLFIGAIGDAEALAGSNPPGVATVIALCRKPVRAKAEGINYLWFPLAEARPVPVGTLDAIIDALWENIRWGTVLARQPKRDDQGANDCGRLGPCRRLQGHRRRLEGNRKAAHGRAEPSLAKERQAGAPIRRK